MAREPALPTAAPPAASVAPAVAVRPTWARVDTAALAHNLAVVDAHVGPSCRVLAVVKADGYGCGAIEAARAFVDAGAWGLAVSLVEEGVELREAGIFGPVVVLGGVPPGSQDVIVHRRLRPVIWSLDHLEMLAAAVRRAGARALPVHLKIDTGMSRLGALPKDLGPLLDWFLRDGGRTLELEGVMTHFACADDTNDEFTTTRQLASFTDCLALLSSRGLEPSLRHASNSAGLVRFPAAHFDMVRPGIALVGAASSSDVELPGLELALTVHSRVLGIRELPEGSRVSYGGTVRLDRDTRLAIVPVGYGDGYPRAMSGRAQMLVRGHRCAVLGNITMDVCMLDVTDLPDVRVGEEVTLLGKQGRGAIDLYEMAQWAGTVPYEITCGLSKRVPRRTA
jgi:alanine racemase